MTDFTIRRQSRERLGDLIARCEDKFIRVSVIPNDYAALEGKRVMSARDAMASRALVTGARFSEP